MTQECKAEGGACNEVKRIKEEVKQLWGQVQTHREDIRTLFAAQEGTKAYVTQILSRIDGLESKLFNSIQQLINAQAEERKAEIDADVKKAKIGSQERTQVQTNWISYAKHLVSATIGALILYVFLHLTKGGIPTP